MAQIACPGCGHLVTYPEDPLAGMLACPSCGKALQEAPGAPPPPDGVRPGSRHPGDGPLAAVMEYATPVEAHLARNLLEAEDIPAVVQGENAAGELFGPGLAQATLLVAEEDLEHARAILEAASSTPAGDEWKEPAGEEEELPEFLEYRPTPRGRRPFRVLRTDRGFRVVGTAPEGEELEEALRAAGVRKGAVVEIGGEELEWQP